MDDRENFYKLGELCVHVLMKGRFSVRRHLQHLKSEVAARAAKAFNPEMRIEALSERVHGDTEHIFNDDFFETLDCVANALDNVEARSSQTKVEEIIDKRAVSRVDKKAIRGENEGVRWKIT